MAVDIRCPYCGDPFSDDPLIMTTLSIRKGQIPTDLKMQVICCPHCGRVLHTEQTRKKSKEL